jgi:hypothetical protein
MSELNQAHFHVHDSNKAKKYEEKKRKAKHYQRLRR